MLDRVYLEMVSVIYLDESCYPVNELTNLSGTESLSLGDTIEFEAPAPYNTYTVTKIDYDNDRPDYYVVYAEYQV